MALKCDILTENPHVCADARFPYVPIELCFFCKKRTCGAARTTIMHSYDNRNPPFIICHECTKRKNCDPVFSRIVDDETTIRKTYQYVKY